MTKEELYKKVETALDEIRPHLKVDGGDLEVVEINDAMELYVRWLGNCESCNMSAMTMKAGVQQIIKDRVPEIKEVFALNGVSA